MAAVTEGKTLRARHALELLLPAESRGSRGACSRVRDGDWRFDWYELNSIWARRRLFRWILEARAGVALTTELQEILEREHNDDAT